MKIAKDKSRLPGKKPKLSRGQEEHLVTLYQEGELAELSGVARSTVYRAIERNHTAASVALQQPVRS